MRIINNLRRVQVGGEIACLILGRGAFMLGKAPAFLHLLVYQCQECDEPIALPVKSDEANLEGTDADLVDVQCRCGWLRKSLGMEAKRHLVISWGNSSNTEVLPVSNASIVIRPQIKKCS